MRSSLTQKNDWTNDDDIVTDAKKMISLTMMMSLIQK